MNLWGSKIKFGIENSAEYVKIIWLAGYIRRLWGGEVFRTNESDGDVMD